MEDVRINMKWGDRFQDRFREHLKLRDCSQPLFIEEVINNYDLPEVIDTNLLIEGMTDRRPYSVKIAGSCLKELDRAAELAGITRSQWLLMALIGQLQDE